MGRKQREDRQRDRRVKAWESCHKAHKPPQAQQLCGPINKRKTDPNTPVGPSLIAF